MFVLLARKFFAWLFASLTLVLVLAPMAASAQVPPDDYVSRGGMELARECDVFWAENGEIITMPQDASDLLRARLELTDSEAASLRCIDDLSRSMGGSPHLQIEVEINGIANTLYNVVDEKLNGVSFVSLTRTDNDTTRIILDGPSLSNLYGGGSISFDVTYGAPGQVRTGRHTDATVTWSLVDLVDGYGSDGCVVAESDDTICLPDRVDYDISGRNCGQVVFGDSTSECIISPPRN